MTSLSLTTIGAPTAKATYQHSHQHYPLSKRLEVLSYRVELLRKQVPDQHATVHEVASGLQTYHARALDGTPRPRLIKLVQGFQRWPLRHVRPEPLILIPSPNGVLSLQETEQGASLSSFTTRIHVRKTLICRLVGSRVVEYQ